MNRTNAPSRRPLWGKVAGALLGAGAGSVLFLCPLGDGLARLSYDLPFLFRHQVPEQIVLVCLDQETKTVLGESINQPLHLKYHTRLLERLKNDQTRLVLYDILFDQQSVEEIQNSGFARALSGGCPVVLVAGFEHWAEANFAFEKPLLPAPLLQEAAAGVGLARLCLDADLAVRRIDPGTEMLPSASWVAVSLLGNANPLMLEERLKTRWLNYCAPPSQLSAIKFEQAIAPVGPPPGFFQNKMVIIGASPSAGPVGTAQDQYANPYSRFGGGLASGATIHALSLLNLLQHDWLVRWPFLAELAIVVLAGLCAGYGLAACRPLQAGLVALASSLAMVALGAVLSWFAQQWFAWLTVASVQVPLALAWSVAFNSVCDYRDKGILFSTLSLHFSPARVKQVLKHPELLRPGAERREVSLLITDIQNFSKVTALMHPEDLVQRLNTYFELAVGCVHETEGTVMDLVGDSIFALWNAPETQPDHRERACRTALLLQQALRQFDAENPGLPLRTRLGLHAGIVWVGNIGSSQRFDYAALGEAVNLTARLEALNKPLGTEILATREIQRVAAGTLGSRLIGHFSFQGIDQPVEVYELLTCAEAATDVAWLKTFAQALHDFQRRDFATADAGFQRVLEPRHNDGPSLFYRQQIRQLQETQLPPDWIGVIHVPGK
jgi:adenylate cyclase